MVTRILFDPRTDNPDGTQAALQAVTIEATPTGIREDGSVFILPSTLTFATSTGAAPILLSAPSASTAWRLAVKNAGQLRQTRIVRFPDVPSITWAALTDVDPASLGTTPGHARQWDATFAELVTLIGSGGSGYLPLWKANTAYTAGQFVVSPTGQIIQANTTFTSGSTYNATNWTVVTGGGGGAVSSVAGRTGAVTLTAADVALGNVNNTSDAGKPISTAQAAVNAVKADLVGGLVPTSQIPALALNTSVTVASQAAMLALTTSQVQPGDLAIRTDGAGTFILAAADPSQLANWVRLNAPTDVVQSVNGQQGTVVLAASDVGAATPASVAAKLDLLGTPVTLTASGTLTAGAWNLLDATSGPLTVTLPTPTKIGQRLIAERADAGTNLISFAGTVRGLTTGLPTFPGVSVLGESIDFEAESLTSWRIIASHKPKALLDKQFVGLGTITGLTSNEVTLSKIDRVLRSKLPRNRGVALETSGTTVNLWEQISNGIWYRTSLMDRTNAPGGVMQMILERATILPGLIVDDGDASITVVGTWTTSAGGRYSTIAGDTQTYTTPAATTAVGCKVIRNNNAGLIKATINGDPTRARLLPTALEVVERGWYPATILTTGGGTLAPTDRVIDLYSGAFLHQDDNVIWANDLPPSAHILQVVSTGYKRTASTAARSWYSGFFTSQGQRPGDAGATRIPLQFLLAVSDTATEYAIEVNKPDLTGTTTFIGSIHNNEYQDSMSFQVDGAAVTPTTDVPLFPVTSAKVIRVSHLTHPSFTGTVANVTTVYELSRDGLVVDVSITWVQSVRITSLFAMLPVNGATGNSGSARLWTNFNRADLLEAGGGPYRLPATADALFGNSKSAAAWVWEEAGHHVAGIYIENNGDFTNNYAIAGPRLAQVQDRNGGETKIYLTREGGVGGSNAELVAVGAVIKWRAVYVTGYLPSPEAVFG